MRIREELADILDKYFIPIVAVLLFPILFIYMKHDENIMRLERRVYVLEIRKNEKCQKKMK